MIEKTNMQSASSLYWLTSKQFIKAFVIAVRCRFMANIFRVYDYRATVESFLTEITSRMTS